MSKNLNQLLSDFTQKPFALQETLQAFKDILVHIFPQIHFSTPHTQGLNGILKSYTTFATPLKLGNDELGIAIFECESIKAKIGIHTELKSLLKSSHLNAILAIFYTTDFSEFRLSLITKTYNLDTDKLSFSNLKRQSFVLGQPKVATAHNALENLINHAQKSQTTLKDLESAFSQEAVSNEFYKGYEKHYKDICQKLTNANLGNVFALYRGTNDNTKAIESFAKKLLGRVVFLYFLQKKRWLGVPKDAEYGNGDLGFLHKLFCKAQQNGENFYATYLCPLFFDSLNSHKENDYSALFDCKIPFLNGGLFEDEFNDSNTSQSQKAHFLIANVLDNDIFREIFDFFESYNFTIEESTPTDTEVSIDPEMLGKVFENLIDYNKASGAFYTPREIVHYMCQSALISHFLRFYPEHRSDIENLILHHQSDSDFIRSNGSEIKAKLLNLKILDPAIGSGAFPMGLLLEIMQVLESLDKTMSYEARARHKRDIIARCIYGIDIDSGAIEIAKLRFWLSIAVDEVCPNPLPNLDFKFMQGNSLLEHLSVGKDSIEIIPKDFMKDLQPTVLFDTNADKVLFQGDTAKKLQNLFLEYYAQSDSTKKAKQKAKIIKIMQEAFDAQIVRITQDIDSHTKNLQSYPLNPSTAKKRENLSNKIESLMMHTAALQSLAKDFIDNDFHTDKLFLYNFFFANIISEGGFDIVIGNPPYIRGQNIPNKEAISKSYVGFACGSADIYTYFFAKGFELLKQKGTLSYIVSNKFTKASYGQNLRNLILQNQIVFYVDCDGVKIFDNAKVDSCIISISKTKPIHTFSYSKIASLQNFANDIYTNIQKIPQQNLNPKFFSFKPQTKSTDLVQKLKYFELKFSQIAQIAKGSSSGNDDVFLFDFVLESKKLYKVKNDFGEFELEKDLLQPFVYGEDIRRYEYCKYATYILYPYDNQNALIKSNTMSKKYPLIYQYLQDRKSLLMQRKIKLNDDDFYKFSAIRNPHTYKKPKVMIPDLLNHSRFGFDNVGFYHNASIHNVCLKQGYENLEKMILGVLNSRLFWFFIRHSSANLGSATRLMPSYLNDFSFPKIDSNNQDLADEIGSLVDRTLESKSQNKDTNELERQIDELVYKLYNLDSKEIDIIKP